MPTGSTGANPKLTSLYNDVLPEPGRIFRSQAASPANPWRRVSGWAWNPLNSACHLRWLWCGGTRSQTGSGM